LLLMLLLVACVAGAVCVAAPVVARTWPAMLGAAAVAAGITTVRFVRFARAKLPAELRRRGLCAACGYDLYGNASGVCPECGRRTATVAGAEP
jgi:hypothetical protein